MSNPEPKETRTTNPVGIIIALGALGLLLVLLFFRSSPSTDAPPDQGPIGIAVVNEMMTNAVRHAGGGGSLILSCVDGSLYCHVSDAGKGIPPEQVNGHPARAPAALALSGRGLWLARTLCDRVDIDTGPGGTRVRLLINVPA